MTQVRPYQDGDRAAWQSYVANCEGSTISHQIGWRVVISRSLGHRAHYFTAWRDNDLVGVLPLFRVRTWWQSKLLVSIPWLDYGGVLANDEEAERALVKAAAELADSDGAKSVELRSVRPTCVDLPRRTDKVTFWLPLNKNPEKLWAGFKAKLRNQIRKADKSGLAAEIGGPELLDDFYTVFCHNMRDLGTPVWGKDLFAAVLKEFSDSARLIVVRKDTEAVAAGLILSSGDKMYVPSASAYRWALKMCPNHALYWTVIKQACEAGYSVFDFGRSSIDSNTYKFKKQWMPEPKQLIWQYHLNKADEVPMISPQNPKYQLFINVWRRLPLLVANFLGPKVIKNFP